MAATSSSQAKASIAATYEKLPWVYTHSLHKRLSIIEACAHNAMYTRTFDEAANLALQKACEEGLISAILALVIPKEVFASNTFSVQRHYPVQVKVYTSMLPEVNEKDDDGPPKFVPGDPGTLRVSPGQVVSLLAVFNSLPFLSDLIHENIGSNDTRLEATIKQYDELAKAVSNSILEATREDGSVDPSALCASWFELIQGVGGKKPFSVNVIEEVVCQDNDKRTLAYRLELFVSKAHYADIQGCFNDYLKELQRRLDFQHQSLSAINDIFAARSQKQDAHSGVVSEAQRVVNNRGHRGGAANQNQDVEPLDERQSLVSVTIDKVRKMKTALKFDLSEAAAAFIRARVRSWEDPILEALFSNGFRRRHGSSNLALKMQSYLMAGDALQPPSERLFAFITSRLNIDNEEDTESFAGASRVGPRLGSAANRTVSKRNRDRSGFVVSFFQNMGNPLQEEGGSRHAIDREFERLDLLEGGEEDEERAMEKDIESSQGVRRQTAIATTLIPDPAVFTATNYLPTISPVVVGHVGDTRGPTNTRDERHLLNIYNPLHVFTSYMNVEAREDQLNFHCYYDLIRNRRPGLDPAKVPLHIYKQGKMEPAHESWQKAYRSFKSMTMGHLVNYIMSDLKIKPEDLPLHFLGFPKTVIEKKLVTLVLPNCMPWAHSMITLPDVIRQNNFMDRSTDMLRGLTGDLTVLTSAESYLETYIPSQQFSLACFYMACRVSVEAMQTDYDSCPTGGKEDIGAIPSLSSKIDGIAEIDNSRKGFLIPSTIRELSTFIRATFSMLRWKIIAAQHNITLRTQIVHRLALELRMYNVRQPDDPNWQDGDIESRSQAVMQDGMDVFNAAGTNAVVYQRIIDSITRRKKTRVDVAIAQISQVDLTNGKSIKNETILDRGHREMTRALENLMDLLIQFCNRVPYHPSIIKEEPSVLIPQLQDYSPTPRPWLPMSKPVAAIFRYFNNQSRTERWSLFPNKLYENTSLLGEYISAVGGVATRYMRITWAHSSFMLSLTASRTSMAYCCGRMVKPVNMALLGPAGISKSYVFECSESVQIIGTARKKVSGSKKVGKIDANNNGETEYEHEMDPALFIDKKNGDNPVFMERKEERKVETDSQVNSFDYHTNVDKSLLKLPGKINGSVFRKEASSMNLIQKSRQGAGNKEGHLLDPPVADRTFVFEPGSSKSTGNVLPGSKQSDHSAHIIGAQCAIIADPLRIRQYLSALLNIHCHLKPEHEPTLKDAVNLALEILREAGHHLSLNQNNNRRNGRLYVLMRQVVFDVAIQAWMRHDPDAPSARHCPISSTGSQHCFKHFDECAFFDFATRYLYATKEVIIYTLTLLTDIFEDPIKRDLIRHFFTEAYPRSNSLLGKYRLISASNAESYDAMKSLEEFKLDGNWDTVIANDPARVDAILAAAERANADPAPPHPEDGARREPQLLDLNYVTITTPYSTYTALCEALGNQINSEFTFSSGQIMGALKRMEKESIDIDVERDGNRQPHPWPLVNQNTGAEVVPRAQPPPLRRTAPPLLVNDAPPPPSVAIQPQATRAAALQMERNTRNALRGNDELQARFSNFAEELLPDALSSLDSLPPLPFPTPGTAADPMQIDEDPYGDGIEDVLFPPNTIDAQETIRLKRKFENAARIPCQRQNFKAKLLTIETVIVGHRKFLQIIVSHEYLRGQAAMAEQGSIWERSPIWKATKKVLGKANLEFYPPFISDKIRFHPDISKEKKDYFDGGEYSYITGRTDATEDTIAPILDEKRKEVEKDHPDCIIPKTIPSVWFSISPVISRNEAAGNLVLPTPMGDNPIDSLYIDAVLTGVDVTPEMAEKALKEEEDEAVHLLVYFYDLDYIALFRRCRCLGWDVTKELYWKTLPIYNVVRKATTGYKYPDKPIYTQAERIARSVKSARKVTSVANARNPNLAVDLTHEEVSERPRSFRGPPNTLQRARPATSTWNFHSHASASMATDDNSSDSSQESSTSKKQKKRQKTKPPAKRRKVK